MMFYGRDLQCLHYKATQNRQKPYKCGRRMLVIGTFTYLYIEQNDNTMHFLKVMFLSQHYSNIAFC